MDIRQKVSLSDYSTMRLAGKAAYLADVHSVNEIAAAVAWAKQYKLPVVMVGIGSNIVWTDKGYPGLVLVNKISGYSKEAQDEKSTNLIIGGGENWDIVVKRACDDGLTGIEALSLIPGTAGATPVQNIGAYGQEIADTLISVDCFDKDSQQLVTIAAADCAFGYRTSRFKTTDHGRFFITSIKLKLKQGNPSPPFYESLQNYLSAHNINNYTPGIIRSAVIDIRQAKLPDPSKVANNGSFFANPIVGDLKFHDLLAKYPNLQYWPQPNVHNYKLSAAWLVEQAGFKDLHDPETGMATWPKQTLVLVNEYAHSTADLLTFKQKIVSKVQDMFGIKLIQEPELLGEV
jgi:UDP-N-acetylmuramate dehydrogenase